MVNRNKIADILNEAQSSRSTRKNAILLRQNLIGADQRQFTKQFIESINRVLVCKKSDSNADRVIKFVAHFVSVLESEDETNATIFGDFVSALIAHLLRGIESREKNVRYRVCQLLAYLMASGLSEIDEDQFEALEKALTKRVRDKESNIRVQAVIALSRFQTPPEDEDEDEEESKITEIMLHLLGHDPSPEVRRAVLHNLTQSPLTLPFLLERARDQDPILRRQVYTSIMPSINGFKPLSISKRNKLLKWGLRDRDESVRRAADKMFAIEWLNLANGSILELLHRLDIVNSVVVQDAMTAFFKVRPEFIHSSKFNDEFWEELNPESAFFVRCMKSHCTDDINDKLPELSSICDLIVKFVNLSREQEEAEKADSEFVVENLLQLAMHADFSDEIGRRRLISNAHEILRSDLNEGLLTTAVEALCKVSLNENDLTSAIREILTDLYDILEDEKEANETFHSANSELEEGDTTVKYIFTTLRALTIIASLLQNISGTLTTNTGLKHILNDFIVPAVRSHEGPIREKGIDCLGLICLLDKSLAKDNLDLFLHCFARGHEELKIQALKIVTDIMMAHPSLLKPAEDAEEEGSLEDDLVRIYLKAFQLDDLPEVTAMATISVSKLLLFNIIAPDSENARGLLKEMAVLYYSADNQTLRQNLAYFFPVYAYSAVAHQEAMITIVVPIIKRMAKVYDNFDSEEKLEAVGLQSIANQLLDWCNPRKLTSGTSDTMVLFRALIKRIGLCEKEEARVLANCLAKVFVPESEEVADLLNDVDCSDANVKRIVAKLKAQMEKDDSARLRAQMENDESTMQ